MNKFWMVYTHKNDGRFQKFENKIDAVTAAKRQAHTDQSGEPVFILETVCVVQRPIPDVEVQDL